MTRKTMEIEAETLEEAREQLQSKIPEGLYLISTQLISHGSSGTIKAAADTVELAFTRAHTEIPVGATIVDKKEFAPQRNVIPIEAVSDQEARRSAEWTAKMKENTTIQDVKLIRPGSKGFAGIGKKPNYYEAELIQQATVEVTYRLKAKFSAELGDQAEIQAIQIVQLVTALKDACTKVKEIEVRKPRLKYFADDDNLSGYGPAVSSWESDSEIVWGKFKAIIKSLEEARAIEALIHAMVISDHDKMQEHITTSLENTDPNWVQSEAAKAAISNAVNNLMSSNQDPSHRAFDEAYRVTAKVLGKIGLPAIEPLIAAIKVGDSWTFSRITELLEQIDPHWIQLEAAKTEIPTFVAMLKNENEQVRGLATRVLGKIGGDVGAVEPLAAELKTGDQFLRQAAAVALGKINDVRVVAPLLATLKDSHVDVRKAATAALAQIGAPAVEPLLAALSDSDKVMREYTSVALGRIGDARAVEPLLRVIGDSDLYVRKAVVTALGQIGDIRAKEGLLTATSDESELVRTAAKEAITQLGSSDSQDQKK